MPTVSWKHLLALVTVTPFFMAHWMAVPQSTEQNSLPKAEFNTQEKDETNIEFYKTRLPANPKTGKSTYITVESPPIDAPQLFTGEQKMEQNTLHVASARAINPTAPNATTQLLRGDFTDSDSDGMTDVAEIKYGFDPHSIDSFPQEPQPIIRPSMPVGESPVNAVIESTATGFQIKWNNPEDGTYSLTLNNGSQQLYYGGHYAEYADVNYSTFNLTGTEILTGSFTKYVIFPR